MSDPILRSERRGQIVVVHLAGEVDLTRTRALRESLLTALQNHDTGLVVDLSDATYLDSAGVNVLFEVAERLRDRQLVLAVVVPEGGLVDRVVSLVKLDAVAPVQRTVDDALNEIPGAPDPESA